MPASLKVGGGEMFLTVKFGANEQVMLNSNCRIINLAEHLKEKARCGPDVTLDLLDENGILANLSEMEDSPEYATNYLHERGRYILVNVIRGEGTEPTRYVSLLENLGRQHPELAGITIDLSRGHGGILKIQEAAT